MASFEDDARRARRGPRGQENVHLDTEPRPTKSPRAFCSTPRVPGGGLPGDRAGRRARRLRRPLPRGRPHRALREHRPGPGVRVPPPRRQLGHRVVRVPARAPGRGSRLASRTARRRGPGAARSRTPAPCKLVFLRRYAAKLAYELELHGALPTSRRCRGATRSCSARRSGSRGRGDLARRRRRRVLRRLLPARLGARDALAAGAAGALRRALVRVAEAGEWLRSLWRTGSDWTPTSCSPRRSGEELDFAAMAPSSRRRTLAAAAT